MNIFCSTTFSIYVVKYNHINFRREFCFLIRSIEPIAHVAPALLAEHIMGSCTRVRSLIRINSEFVWLLSPLVIQTRNNKANGGDFSPLYHLLL